LKRCYNASVSASWLAFSSKVLHTATGLYPGAVRRFIAPSRFLKTKLESFGFRLAPIEHVPNPLVAPEAEPVPGSGAALLFAGQIIRRKGVFTLASAMERVDAPLVVAGTGPDLDELRMATRGSPNISLLGYRSGEELENLYRNARAVVVPSESYDNQPFSILEAFGHGKPVVGADIGGIPELIGADRGWLVPAQDPTALAKALNEAIVDDSAVRSMGAAARRSEASHDCNPGDLRLLSRQRCGADRRRQGRGRGAGRALLAKKV
jgi:glycosyltransferase involved in cell wall biosynthesis